MITLCKIRTSSLVILAGSAFLAAASGNAARDMAPYLTRPTSAERGSDADGFIQRWLILEPIPANGLTDSLVQAAVKREYFPDQFTVIPHDGDKVTVGNTELTWHAVDTNDYNVNLYYFAYGLGKPTSNVLFWAVTVVDCPQEMPGVRLAIGSNAASVWWVNGKEVIGIYRDRQTVIDDGVSKRLTLKKGPNVVRCAVVNGGGATDFCARFLDKEDNPLKGFTVSVGDVNATQPAAPSTARSDAPKLPFATPLHWKSTGVLVKPVSDETHNIVSVKDPTIVRYNDLWHIYATVYSNSARTWSMVYLKFKDFSDAPKAKLHYVDMNPNLRGYHCAPNLFYFRPHKKWYLVFQSQQPQYCTADDLSKPETWTKPQDFFESKPSGAPRLWIDYWVICDDTHAYLYFTGDNGRVYRSRTRIEDFPKGMSDPEICIEGPRNDVFEGSMTYRIKGTGMYLTLVEAIGPARYYRAWIADSLDGEWKPVPDATTWEKPFAGINNVTFEDGVTPWTRDISHGELIRDGYDETMTIDPDNLRLLYQGRDPAIRARYDQLPYRLGLLTVDRSSKED